MEQFDSPTTVERQLIAKASAGEFPINGSLELLPLCNLNCKMCYVHLSKAEMEAQGGLRSGKEWLQIGEKLQKAGVLFLLLTGGEPLLHPDFKEIYLGLFKMGLILTINTNGTLIDDEWVEFFAQHPPRRMNITVYGASNETYQKLCGLDNGFDRVRDGIRKLKHAGIMVKIAVSAVPDNEADIDDLFAFAQEEDCALSCDAYMMPATRERSSTFSESSRLTPERAAGVHIKFLQHDLKEQFPNYALEMTTLVDRLKQDRMIREAEGSVENYRHPERISCLAGSCSFTVNWQGEMRPCVILEKPAVNLFETEFSDAWKMLRSEVSKIHSAPECSICEYKPLCRTCAAAGLYEEGDSLLPPKYLCAYARESDRLLREFLMDEKGEGEE